MGMDIHMSVIRGGEYVKKEIFDGRNSEWFRNLQGEGWADEYDHLPTNWNLPEEVPADIMDDLKSDGGYFGFRWMTVSDFLDWFDKYRPDRDAGWVSTYDKWRIENKGYVPDDPQHYLSDEDNRDDMHFVEFEDEYDCSRWLADYLRGEKDFLPNDIIIFYFDW